MKNTLLFCTGESGSGKSFFIKNILLPRTDFYNLKSATTRPMRTDPKDKNNNEQDGREYYFRDESYFDTEKFVVKLWVNEQFWNPEQPKWMYGVPEFEVFDHLGANLTYDVIQPRYIRQMIDWFVKNKLDKQYDFKIAWFHPLPNTKNIVKKRQNMPKDKMVRDANTCSLDDFNQVGLIPDFAILRDPPHGYFLGTRGDGKILPTLTMSQLLFEHEYGNKK